MALVERDTNLPAAAAVVESTRIGPDPQARKARQDASAAKSHKRRHARSQASQEETDRKNAERARKAREKRRSAAARQIARRAMADSRRVQHGWTRLYGTD